MTARLIAIIVILSLIGGGVIWLTSIIIKAERAKALQAGVELVQERDKLNVKVRNATAGDICRRLGGVMLEDGECG